MPRARCRTPMPAAPPPCRAAPRRVRQQRRAMGSRACLQKNTDSRKIPKSPCLLAFRRVLANVREFANRHPPRCTMRRRPLSDGKVSRARKNNGSGGCDETCPAFYAGAAPAPIMVANDRRRSSWQRRARRKDGIGPEFFLIVADRPVRRPADGAGEGTAEGLRADPDVERREGETVMAVIDVA